MDPERASLQSEDDLTFHRRAAVVGTAARWGLAVVIGLALLGLFGGVGPLVSTEASGARGLGVRYDRFARLDAPMRLRVTLPRGDSAFAIAGGFSRDLNAESISPAPEAEASVEGGVRYVFASGEAPIQVALVLRPVRFGGVGGEIVLDSGDRVAVRTFVYP